MVKPSIGTAGTSITSTLVSRIGGGCVLGYNRSAGFIVDMTSVIACYVEGLEGCKLSKILILFGSCPPHSWRTAAKRKFCGGGRIPTPRGYPVPPRIPIPEVARMVN